MARADVHEATRLLAIAPQFLVDDLALAVAYYREKLGFEVEFEYEGFYASVTRDGFPIDLKEAPKLAVEREHRRRNEHLDAYISVCGIESLFKEIEARGAEVLTPLQQRPWACVDFYVKDREGYILCFSEPV